ncbi:MAG: Rne/Rng family ribonuclease [Candidatus Rokuibacteriota bacterium]|nr:MAG: Rne/Rng family ribonuclease [Candidatus Rokubacteria bacterium]
MGKRIVVNAGITETRVGVQEGSLLTELYVERHHHRSIVGSVYKGVVTNVLPGMQAAFVDIGLQKDAFLYAGDYTTNLGDFTRAMLKASDEESETEGESEAEAAAEADVDVEELAQRREPSPPIEEMLHKGQTVLVQVSKESLGTKGARITSFISLPGRYLVYMPQVRHIGVSRRIRDERERDRLRAALRSLDLPSGGFIVRTNAEGKSAAEFAADVEFLSRLWAQIQARFEQAGAPAALHEEGDLTFRVVRDLFSPEVDEFVVDSREVYDKCAGYVGALVPALADRVRLYEDRQPIFDALGVEKEIEKALRRRVWLKSGGYIVIDHTEALVSIDVNTGKYVGKRDFEQTVLKINLEAVGEVVRQIRLRDLGGIIIIDFIDMESAEHREQVYRALKRALAEDKARTNVLEISELGLVEMTRKRVRQDLRALLSTRCPSCKGSGVTKSDATIAADIFRAVQAKVGTADDGLDREVAVRVHPDLARYYEGDGQEALERLARLLDRKITVQPNFPDREGFEVRLRGGGP